MRIEPLFSGFGASVIAERRGGIEALADHAADFTRLLAETGVILFRGFELDAERLARFAGAFMTRPLVYGGARARVSADDRVQLAESGQLAIGLHCEMAYTPFRPDLCFFACERPPAAGGETTLADGVAILAGLSAETRHAFAEQKIEFVRTYPAIAWRRMFGIATASELERLLNGIEGLEYAIGAEGELSTRYETEAIVTRPGVAWRAFANSVNNIAGPGNPRGFYSAFAGGTPISAGVRAELAARHRSELRAHGWQTGDVLMIDNWRVLHGRNAFEDSGRRILAMFGDR